MAAELFQRIVVEPREGSAKLITAVFFYGNKRLDMDIDLHDYSVGVGISTVENTARVDGATTTLYERAYGLMHYVASILHRPLTYTFVTNNPQMRMWAKTHGEELFHWDEQEDNGVKFKGIKVVSPFTQTDQFLNTTYNIDIHRR